MVTKLPPHIRWTTCLLPCRWHGVSLNRNPIWYWLVFSMLLSLFSLSYKLYLYGQKRQLSVVRHSKELRVFIVLQSASVQQQIRFPFCFVCVGREEFTLRLRSRYHHFPLLRPTFQFSEGSLYHFDRLLQV